MGGVNSGRRSTLGKLILDKAVFCQTVAAIVRETGAKPNTVRSVLRRAADQGEITYTRFRSGRSSRAIRVEQKDNGAAMLEDIFFGRNLK
jgi:predicted transcriptional regulator